MLASYAQPRSQATFGNEALNTFLSTGVAMPKGKVKTNRAKVRRRLQKQRKRRREVEKIKDAKENVLHPLIL